MSAEKDFFDAHIKSLSNLTEIYKRVKPLPEFPGENVEHILRSEFVLIVSAFDTYVHNIVRRKLTEDFFSLQSLPSSVNRKMALYEFRQVMSQTNLEAKKQELGGLLREHMSFESYQKPDNVKGALKLLQINDLWRNTLKTAQSTPAIGCTLIGNASGDCKTGDEIKNKLKLIAQRRNQIAHESDTDYTLLVPQPRAITVDDVADCRQFLTELVACMDYMVENRSL